MAVTTEQVRWFRLRQAELLTPFPTPEAAAEAHCGIQAQILVAAGLALWQRTPDLTYAALDARLHTARTLVKLWGQRGTLHLYPSADWPLLCSALSIHPTWWERQAKQRDEHAVFEATITRVAALLQEHGTLTRTALRQLAPELEETYHSSWGGIFGELTHRGIACHAGKEGSAGRFAHRPHWLPDLPWNPPDPEQANRMLAERYFRCYGPATEQDFRYWRGTRAAHSRRWIAALGETLEMVDVAGEAQLVHRDARDALHTIPPERDGWPVKLLYRFDPYLLAHKDKGWLIDAAHYPRVWRPAGHIEGTLLEHGRIAGTWRYDRAGGGLIVTLEPFAPLPRHVQQAVERQAEGIAAFLDLPLVEIITT